MLVEIKNDVFFISSRIKEIDKDYIIFFNTEKRAFEIHNKAQIGGSYCLTVPYSLLDERTLKYVRETSIENKQQLLEKIERNNEMLEKMQQKRILENAKDQLYDQIKYSTI